MHGWNQELQRSLHGHTLAEMRGVSFCYNTLIAEMQSVPFVRPHMTKSDSWNTRTKSRAAMLSLRTYNSWNAQCSFCYITYDSCNARMKSGVAMLSSRTYDSWNARNSFCYNTSIAEMHGVPFVTTRRLAEMYGILFVTHMRWLESTVEIQSCKALFTNIRYDSWNAKCFFCSIIFDS